ncbi:hypothetical protein M5C99_03770 [Acidovorax sp. NCPPB 2350]|nr:hypothetical protein M5C99_03770 [Acidovorax sp. NCPPB 2350]
MPFLFFMSCLIAVNAWLTIRVRRATDLDHKGMHIAMVWIVPFMGALLTHWHLRPYERSQKTGARPASRESEEQPEEIIHAPGVLSLPFTSHLVTENGFPMPDWPLVNTWLDSIASDGARLDARLRCHRSWLLHLRTALGPHFWLHETANAFVLSSLEENVAQATARYVSSTRTRIGRLLGNLAHFPEGEKSILLVLDDEDWYYNYISVFYPDQGEFAFSGGIFVGAGCPHFVVRRGDLAMIEPVIAHELTHSALAHLQLPLWIDEGIAVNTEHKLVGSSGNLHTPQEIREKHLRFWGAAEIRQFWTGESFARADDGNMLSYDLARTIVEQLGKSWDAFELFVKHAQRVDAGAASAAEHFDLDLGAYVCALFDRPPSEDWAPRPQALAKGPA